MIKVFLVEDEIIMREGIKNNIDWDGEGFSFVGEASDGELAYPLILKYAPDIVITDIKMPFMDGLELSRLIKTQMPKVKIIVLSGYDEFEYAKEAISIGITDYLVKPITGAKLLEAIKKVAKTIEEEKEQKEFLEKYHRERIENLHLERQKFLNNLIGSKLSVSELLESGKKLGIDLSAESYNIILFKVFSQKDEVGAYSKDQIAVAEEIEEMVSGKNNICMFDQSVEGWVFLVKSEEGSSIEEVEKKYLKNITNIVSAYPELSYFAGVGIPVKRLRELNTSYDNAGKAFAYRYLMQGSQIIYSKELEGFHVPLEADINLNTLDVGKMDRKIVENFLRSGSADETRHFIDEYFLSLGESNVNSLLFRQYIAMDMYFCIVSLMEELDYDPEIVTDKCGDFREIANILSSLGETKIYLTRIFQEAIALRDLASKKKYSHILMAAKEYIQANFQKEDVSLNTVAASVNISPNHFSTIFSQEMDQTFIEYLTNVRMEKAKELLKCSGMKSSEIGYSVGYKDPHYFSYIFKKTQDCTPKEFRMRGKINAE